MIIMKKANKLKFARIILGYVVSREYFIYYSDDTFTCDVTIQINEDQQKNFNLNSFVARFEEFYNADCFTAEVDLKTPMVTLKLKSKNYLPF